MGCTSSPEDQTLTLGLGSYKSVPSVKSPDPNKGVKRVGLDPDPCLTLSLSAATEEPWCSAASSLSNVVVSVKRERETASSEDLDVERGSSRVSDEEEDGSGPAATATTRKKLRLTKDQSALLEESFKQHSTLNPKQKQALADRLNLLPRQVEVWFQNRRARTKLKQTEVDCEYLKKCYEKLTEENRRLQKELQELKALKLAHPFYMHLPAATLTMCPSCERIGAAAPAPSSASTPPFSMGLGLGPGPNKSHFYPPSQIRPLLVDN